MKDGFALIQWHSAWRHHLQKKFVTWHKRPHCALRPPSSQYGRVLVVTQQVFANDRRKRGESRSGEIGKLFTTICEEDGESLPPLFFCFFYLLSKEGVFRMCARWAHSTIVWLTEGRPCRVCPRVCVCVCLIRQRERDEGREGWRDGGIRDPAPGR